MYKKISKQKNDSWDDISRRTFGTPERSGDFEKLNCGTLGDEVIIFEDVKASEDKTSSGVILQVEDAEYTNFSEYKLIDCLDGVKAGVFIFLLSNVNNTSGESASFLKKGQPVKVIDGADVFLEGRIANIKPVLRESHRSALDENSSFSSAAPAGAVNFVQVEVKSNAGILIETVVPHPLEFGTQSIKECLTTLVGYYGQTIEFEDDGICNEIFTNEIGTSFAAKNNETVFQFIYRIIASRGLTIKDTGHSLKIFKLNPETCEKINFIEGKCIGAKSIRANFIGDNLARYYEINSGYPLNNSVIITTPISTPITKRIESDDINSNDLQSAGERMVCKRLGEHFNIYIELSDDFSIEAGEIATIKYPSILIYEETDFVIKQVAKIKPDILELILTLPCVYTGIMPEALPLTY